MKLFSKKNFRAGFTLIELLIVIAILGILAAGIVVVINPMEKINSANMAKAETFAAGIRNSLAMNLVGEWTFDGNVNDTSGYGNDGTISGANCATSLDRKNQAGKACSFDGVDDYISMPYIGAYSMSGDFTIEMWFRPDRNPTTTDQMLSNFDTSTNRSNYEIYYGDFTNNKFGMRWTYNGGTWATFSANFTTVPGNWYHVALVHTNTMRWFVNGVQTNTRVKPGTPDVNTRPLLLGVRSIISQPFYGVIDDVRIYKSALLSSQIQQLYAQGLVKHLLALK